MTDHDDLPRLDETARRAADGLRAHVTPRVDARSIPWADLPAPSGRKRGLVLLTVAALALGAVALADQRGDGPGPDDENADVLELEPIVLELAGPRDGNESIGLPLALEPATGLTDGETVRVTGSGFVPGESVGIVQCAEAMPDQPGDAIDSCDISPFTQVTANSDGVATGSHAVHRTLTTPRTGTVDCLVEAGRCVVAMGALNDYDRSGVHQILFGDSTPTGDPPPAVDLPTATVTPLVGLADGDSIHLDGTGFQPNDQLSATLCSIDPAVCWQLTGPDASGEEPALVVDADGHVAADLQVWRYLPGSALGTYVDCAISRCELRLDGTKVPEPIALGFVSGGEPPTGSTIGIDPREGLAAGDAVTIAGAGFFPGETVYFEVCAAAPDDPEAIIACTGVTGEPVRADDDGALSFDATIPSFGGTVEVATTVCGATPGQCRPGGPTDLDVRCDGIETSCTLVAYPQGSGLGYGRPTFGPAPVPITFR